MVKLFTWISVILLSLIYAFECVRVNYRVFTGGVVAKDTVLTHSENTVYHITNDINVTQTSTLTIEPGVTLKIAPHVNILINGAIRSIGTLHKPILFEGNGATNIWNDGEHGYMSNKVRLVNGDSRGMGLLEISNGRNRHWEAVCDFLNTWDTTRSMVVCRQLGFWEGEKITLNISSTGNISSKLFECEGHETEIRQCVRFGDYYLSNCLSNQLVSLRCKNPLRGKWNGIQIHSKRRKSSIFKYTKINDAHFAIQSTGLVPEIDHVSVNYSIYGFIFKKFISNILISNTTVKSALFSVMVKGYRGRSILDWKRIEFHNCSFSSNDTAISINNLKAWNVPIDIHQCQINGSASFVEVQSPVNLTFVDMNIKPSLLGKGIAFKGCQGRIIILNSTFQYHPGHKPTYLPLKAAIHMKENSEQIDIVSCVFDNVALQGNLIEIYSTTKSPMVIESNSFLNNACEYLIAAHIVDDMYLFEYTGDPSEFTQVIEIRKNKFIKNRANILKTKDYSIYYPPGSEMDFFSFWRISGVFVGNTVVKNVPNNLIKPDLIKLLLAFGNWIISDNTFIDNTCDTVINLQMGAYLDRSKINYILPEPYADISKNLFINNGQQLNIVGNDKDTTFSALYNSATITVKGNTSSLRISYNILSNPYNEYELVGMESNGSTIQNKNKFSSCNKSNECLRVNATCNFWGVNSRSRCRILSISDFINIYYNPILLINIINELPTSISAVQGECRQVSPKSQDEGNCISYPTIQTIQTMKRSVQNKTLLRVGLPLILIFVLLVSIMCFIWCIMKRQKMNGSQDGSQDYSSSEKVSGDYLSNGVMPEKMPLSAETIKEFHVKTNGRCVPEFVSTETHELIIKSPQSLILKSAGKIGSNHAKECCL